MNNYKNISVNKEKTALVAGSFDPVTAGHIDLIKRAAQTYSVVYAVVFVNREKEYMFPIEKRKAMLEAALKDMPNVRADLWTGMLYEYVKLKGIDVIVKGIRSEQDAEYERQQAEYNFAHSGVKTVLMEADAAMAHISSTLARRLISENKSLEGIVPAQAIEIIRKNGK